jgi:hypothetical protein
MTYQQMQESAKPGQIITVSLFNQAMRPSGEWRLGRANAVPSLAALARRTQTPSRQAAEPHFRRV